jgi:HSP20 family protein
MEAMQNRLSSFLDFEPVRSNASEETEWAPLVDVIESADEYLIRAEIPGVNKSDLSVTLEDGYLFIKGKRNAEPLAEGSRYLNTETAYGPFSRTIELPSSADAAKIEASYKDGILSVRVAKDEKAKPRQITVTSE